MGRLSFWGGGAESLGSFVVGVFAKHPRPMSGASRVRDRCSSISLVKYGQRRRRKFMVHTRATNDRKDVKLDCRYRCNLIPRCKSRFYTFQAVRKGVTTLLAALASRKKGMKELEQVPLEFYLRDTNQPREQKSAVCRSTPCLQTFGFRPRKIPDKKTNTKHQHSRWGRLFHHIPEKTLSDWIIRNRRRDVDGSLSCSS